MSSTSPGADGTGSLPVPGPNEKIDPSQLLKLADCPPFPLEELKDICLASLVECINQGGAIRDPAGGSFEHLLL